MSVQLLDKTRKINKLLHFAGDFAESLFRHALALSVILILHVFQTIYKLFFTIFQFCLAFLKISRF